MVGGFLIGPRVNLWNQDLSGLSLSKVILTNANFARTLMENTNFTNATMPKINISSAIANGATFTGTSLANANMTGIRAVGIVGSLTLSASVKNLNQNLVSKGFSLYRATLSGADFSGMDLTVASFYGANLSVATGSTIAASPRAMPNTHRVNAGALEDISG